MDLEYDRKFEEMKKYIPFLESMIKRLESTSSASANPRQAQLDKIRSLRDLLLDKKKRMKMENLLKCEQVLVNLYAKVEQRDALPGIKPATDPAFQNTAQTKEENELELVRNKLKNVSTKRLEGVQETFEIARASATEELCTPGSKEPALFQRRPNNTLPKSPNKPTQITTKRNYTRVLVSPEPDSRRWENEDPSSEKPLFSRRSPRRSPKRYSPSHNKKDKKKYKQSRKGKDLNITLNVPEESLDSLNTKDILTRIMTCSDNDVDIETLREAKRQILNELKHTGAKCDDISDLLLKSYKKKKTKKKTEVEEGEISDSESEAIESIYGGFMLEGGDNATSKAQNSDNKEKPRKIQICLVINSDNDKNDKKSSDLCQEKNKTNEADVDFEMYEDKVKIASENKNVIEVEKASTKAPEKTAPEKTGDTNSSELLQDESDKNLAVCTSIPESGASKLPMESKESNKELNITREIGKPANFYKPLIEHETAGDVNKDGKPAATDTAAVVPENESSKFEAKSNENNSDFNKPTKPNENKDSAENLPDIAAYLESTSTESKDNVEIPLLNEPSVSTTHTPEDSVVSEIDILQALKKEILSESLSIPGSEGATPALHQPKLTKVSNAQEIATKKRISIEKYKEKVVTVPKTVTPLFFPDIALNGKEDNSKKQSLKLTERECERFKLPPKLNLGEEDISDDDLEKTLSLDDIYGNLAPKSPENNDSANTVSNPPVIIPVEPTKPAIAPCKADVDMRTMLPKMSPNLSKNKESPSDVSKELTRSNVTNRQTKVPVDPRIRRDKNQVPNAVSSPRPPLLETPIVTQASPIMSNTVPNMTPNRAPSMTPNRVSNMTPSRAPSMTPSMTPNARTYDIPNLENNRKHVYAPTLYDPHEREQSITREQRQRPYWETNQDKEKEIRKSKWEAADSRDSNRDPWTNPVQRDSHEYQKSRYGDSHSSYNKSRYNSSDLRDSFHRLECPQTPVHPFGRSDCPSTPSHPFGRMDTSMTPVHPFGMSDCPLTPSHPFGRSDCPSTPSHSFGRSDCPPTPSHPFGRSDCPPTPSHPFGRVDMPMTPSHPFGRSDAQPPRDPRLNRSTDYDYQRDDRDRHYHRDQNNYNNSKQSYGHSDYRNYREQSVGKNERNKFSSYDQSGRKFNNRDHGPRREPSIGRTLPVELETDRRFSNDRKYGGRGNDYSENENSRSSSDFGSGRTYQRERSVGRSMPNDDRTRAPSVGRNYLNEEPYNNKTSVKPHAGRSFTIDTSVNSTFQDFLGNRSQSEVFNQNFDARRRRASSVGRSLCRETSVSRSFPRDTSVGRSFYRENSVGRSLPHKSNVMTEKHSFVNNSNRNNFRRAASMGRELVNVKMDKSLKDIKADFEKFKSKLNFKYRTTDEDSSYSSNKQSFRSRKEKYESKAMDNSGKKPYSPRKNYRDPRLRRDIDFKNRHKEEHTKTREKKNVGIVYSNDNITKGTILGSGYGVKNYKIPKIKRPVEEKEEIETKEVCISKTDAKNEITHKKSDEPVDKNVKKKKSEIQDDIKPKSQTKAVEEKTEKRMTRSNTNSGNRLLQTIEDESIKKTKKPKKPIIYDSDSDDEKPKDDKVSSKTSDVLAPALTIDNTKNNVEKDKEVLTEFKETKEKDSSEQLCLAPSDDKLSTQLNSSFSVDDLFPDNMAEHGIDDISSLIAELDNDIEPNKTECTDLSNDISIENILKSPIISGEEPMKKVDNKSEVIKNELITSEKTAIKNFEELLGNSKELNSVKDDLEIKNKDNMQTSTEEQTSVDKESPCSDELNSKNICTNENIVSTTEIDKNEVTTIEELANKKLEQSNFDGSSTPDSTNEIGTEISSLEPGVADSTNEVPSETVFAVTSSHHPEEIANKDNTELSSSNKESATSLNNIGSILSILQDKSKLKEILSMLGDQSSENEKIKKTLEKLSSIVSDEEDSNDETGLNEEEKSEDLPDSKNKKTSDTIQVTKNSDADVNDAAKSVIASNVEKPIPGSKENDNKDVTLETNSVDTENKEAQNVILPDSKPQKQVTLKKGKVTKKGKKNLVKKAPSTGKRLTRSGAANVQVVQPTTRKRKNRELMQLQEDIKEMFISDDVLNATGLRMCRLAKLVEDKKKDDSTSQDSTEPFVILEKIAGSNASDETPEKPTRKKPGPKPKPKPSPNINAERKVSKKPAPKYKPGPKSKTKAQKSDDEDPYAFESDSLSEISNFRSNDDTGRGSSDSENESLASSKSFGSTDVSTEIKKKPKRKKSGWQSGVIKPKNRKKKTDMKKTENPVDDNIPAQRKNNIPDMNCFTDKTYCFEKNVFTYSCRLCTYSGDDIVNHYKQQHPHSEIPLSRLSIEMAKEAIEQCEEINFQAISKIPTEKYVCRFCFKDFGRNLRKNNVLEAFFWHVVSMHTGEYKQLCSICVETRCPFNLDIPPPPKDVKGQLIGYICEKCNFTQISLENLKTHVIVRHNDVQTEVYTINLAVMTKKTINELTKRLQLDIAMNEQEKARVLRSSRSNQSVTEASDDNSDVSDSDMSNEPLLFRRKRIKQTTSPEKSEDKKESKVNYQSKIAFETDDNLSDVSNTLGSSQIKEEQEEGQDDNLETSQFEETQTEVADVANPNEDETSEPAKDNASDDIFDYPHFKIHFTAAGTKEYLCCINGKDNHYKTSLLISMKKHVQSKHAEIWEGYCYVCKVIVMPQGNHKFKDCFQHYLDKHMDNFPILENLPVEPQAASESAVPKPTYINVRPISELMSNEIASDELPALPKIESVVSLGSSVEETAQSPIYTPVTTEPTPVPEKEFKYEEVQAEVMAKKHRVVIDTMMDPKKLVNVYKCAGRFCSFTTDSAEEALLHASTHQRVGGEGSLVCAYCDFDCSGNAIDLVMHVFKAHGSCPFACGYCFYRAAASQVLIAHSSRMHSGKQAKVYTSQGAALPPAKDAAMLPREAVVQYYVCPHSCKFRTYTAGKFCEHLLQRHSSEIWHPCNLCSQSLPSPADLIQHMKSHELNVYQCTWCVHGADTETTLLYHTSQRHPHRQPQAYLRVITSKDGSSEFRVLPLASFNKTKVPVTELPPAPSSENPVREAERSIELEKLIGHTTQMIEINANRQQSELDSAIAQITPEEPPPLVYSPAVTSCLDQLPARVQTPPVQTPIPQEPPPASSTPVVKSEPVIQTPKDVSGDVICLDSDEEDTRHNVIALSDDDGSLATITTFSNVPRKNTSPDDDSAPKLPPAADNPGTSAAEKQFAVIDPNRLFKCPSCLGVYRNVTGFKRHTGTCCAEGALSCAHCGIVAADRHELVTHYVQDHSCNAKNICGECNQQFVTLPHVKLHMKRVHKYSKCIVQTTCNEHKQVEYTVKAVRPPERQTPKRKLSAAGPEPPAKIKRYGPEDIGQLPVKPILDDAVHCSLCEYNTKVRLNMVRHLQLHAEQQPVPQTAPVNPVPHLETNEKHFDRMVNLASSSIVTRAPEKPRSDSTPTVSHHIPPEAASRYPKYVPERQRLTCGAKDCSYISLDEAMLRCHWDTLHTGSNYFHCVHCPPYQHLDTSKPLTAARIIAHLKLHDSTLYACSACDYYHYKRQVLDKHLAEVHRGQGQVMVVREEAASPTTNPAPTMDLKPWQCGLCSFKSMLRPEVTEHCAKLHQSKMQFKCAYCPFRTSAIENITKHQTNSHSGRPEEIFYYYYREGSVPDDADGRARWVKQREKMGLVDTVKSEEADSIMNSNLAQLLAAPQKPVSSPRPSSVDLNIVKKEVEDQVAEGSVEELCRVYGQFCEPNGLRYKCPLCKVVVEDTENAMQSHLYEELNYRKWACAYCSYKAFHVTGLNEHISSEHRGLNRELLQLPLDTNIEKWVTSLLKHQTNAIKKNIEKLAQQRIQTERPAASTNTDKSANKDSTDKPSDKFSLADLEKAFGQFGAPNNMSFCCPKCTFNSKDEDAMRDHLEGELTKIRWCCSHCTDNFQTYHEAQFHCKSHAGPGPGPSAGPARPLEAVRDTRARAAWLDALLRHQKDNMSCDPTSNPETPPAEPDNSLLVVRYEETLPPDEPRSKRSRSDSDDERLLIDERDKKKGSGDKCPYCDYSSRYKQVLRDHMFRHFNMKPYVCTICGFTGFRNQITNHLGTKHSVDSPTKFIRVAELPSRPPAPIASNKNKKVDDDASKVVCLTCEKLLIESDLASHTHDRVKPEFAKKGDVVVICCICYMLRLNLASYQEHHRSCHPSEHSNYAFFKLLHDTREIKICGYCNKKFRMIKDLRAHHNATHSTLQLKYTTTLYSGNVDGDNFKEQDEEVAAVVPKRVARKSTSKLPAQTVARKSTTKLPFMVYDESEVCQEEYSYYGTKPPRLEQYENVTTLMSFGNSMLPFTLKKLSDIIKINPVVLVKDVNKEPPQ